MDAPEEPPMLAIARFVENLDGISKYRDVRLSQSPSGMTKGQKKIFKRKSRNYSVNISAGYNQLKGNPDIINHVMKIFVLTSFSKRKSGVITVFKMKS